VFADAASLHTRAIQTAIDACAATGGGRVVLQPGTFRSGTIVLRSGVTLHLEKGVVLRGSTKIDDYLRPERPLNARLINGVAAALVYAEGVHDIAITGEGTIDGSGAAFCSKRTEKVDWIEEKRALGLWIPGFDNQSGPRPRALVQFAQCRGVRLDGVRLVDSPAWMVHLLACDDVRISRVVLRGLVGGSNTDGFDLDACCDVRIEHCDIETGDDAIALKNTGTWGLQRPSRDIVIRRCRLASTTHGFTIGTETQEDFEDITLADSTIEGATGHRVLTGIGLDMVDGARLRRVTVSDVSIMNAIAPVHVRLGNAGRGQAQPAPGEIRDIVFERLAIRRAFGNSLLAGLPGHPLRNVAWRQVCVEFADQVDPARILRIVPELDGEFPANFAWRQLPAWGLYARHLDGLQLADVTFVTETADPRPAWLADDVARLVQQDVRPPIGS
jgi:polygalacturonase